MTSGTDRLVQRLNSRQQSVLKLVALGLRNAEIAHQLRLSERTVKGYVSQLFLIFGACNRTELVGLFTIDLPVDKRFQ